MIARTARDIAGKLKGWRPQRCSCQLRGSECKPESLQPELERLREQVRQRNQRIAELERQVEEQQKKLGKREKELADAGKKIEDAEKKITDLERQLALRRRNSTTTSKPPSSDGQAGQERPRGCGRKKSRRRAGGQKGHPGHWRPLVPPQRVNQVVDVFPAHCQHCQRELPADPATRLSPGEPRRHQVTELPRIEAHITEYRLHQLFCADCEKLTQAALPEGVQGQFGPQLTALMAYMTVMCRIPRRLMKNFLEEVLGIPLSLGSTQKAWEEASAAVAEPYRELEQALPRQPVLNADETSSRTKADKRWLWVFVAPRFVFYTIAMTRGTEVLLRLLGEEFAGILGNDRFSSYLKYLKKNVKVLMQFCWAHFKRNLLGAQEMAQSRRAQRFCREALGLEQRLFRLWYRFRGGVSVRASPLTRQQLIKKSIPLQKKFFALGQRYLDCDDAEVRNLARALFWHNEKFFTFLEHEGVEPTNNGPERALRPAVQWRKITFGNRSAEGERAVARLLTVRGTCQMHKRNTLAYLTEAIQCYRTQQPVPSLLMLV
jgi:transposase